MSVSPSSESVRPADAMNYVKPLPGAWLIVALLWLVGLLNYLDRIMLTTMRGSLMEAIPMTDAQFGLLTSAFLWVYGLLSPVGGFLADRFSRSRVIIVSLLAWSALTWLTANAQNFAQLLTMRALMGISEACYLPAALALIADYHRGDTRSFATGVHMTGIFVGSGLGGLGGLLAERHGWSYAFSIFGVGGIAYACVLLAFLRDPPEATAMRAASVAMTAPRATFGEAVSSLLSQPAFLVALSYWGLLGVAGWAVVGWMPTYLTAHFHVSQGVGGLSATGYLQLATSGGVLVGGWWADRWSRRNERGRIYVPMIGLAVAAPAILLATHTNVLPVAIAGLMVYGLARSFSDANMMPILCLVADERYRATGYGILNMFACVIGGVTIYIGGALRDAQVELDRVFLFASASLAASAILLSFVRPARNSS